MKPSPETLGAWLLGQEEDSPLAGELNLYRDLEEQTMSGVATYRGLPLDVDPHRLEQSGWGVVWTEATARCLRPLLEPLLTRRKQQAGAKYKELYLDGSKESAALLLARHGEVLGTILRTEKVPYYLLILGGPEEIPFGVQYHLGISHAVGRLYFANDADYRAYADHVVAAERGGVTTEPTVGLFSVENDPATRLFGDRLITPLAEALEGYCDDWDWVQYRRSEATRSKLEGLLSTRPPSLLLISSHGRCRALECKDQETRQGAVLCEPEVGATSPEDLELGGSRLRSVSGLRGQVCFLFSCYAAGTPIFDSYPFQSNDGEVDAARQTLAKRPFVASLPQALLSQGALGFFGHVDRSWSLSFAWAEFHYRGQGKTVIELDALATLENSFKMLLRGERLGHALRSLHQRFSFLSGRLAMLLHRLDLLAGRHSAVDLERLGYLWTGVNDARNLILLGDPAVYLRGQRSTPDYPVRLTTELMLEVEQTARTRGLSVERWIEQLIRDHLRTD